VPVTAADLRSAETDFEDAEDTRERLRERRNQVVLTALTEGWTHQQISDATGLSRGRISQIARSERTTA
jgi:DNA-directed RNA polymerase specialized sigma24 family protein